MVGQLMSKAAAMSPEAIGPLRSISMMRRRTGCDRALNREFIGRSLIREMANGKGGAGMVFRRFGRSGAGRHAERRACARRGRENTVSTQTDAPRGDWTEACV